MSDPVSVFAVSSKNGRTFLYLSPAPKRCHVADHRSVETANRQGFAALPNRFEKRGQDYVLRVWTPDLPPEKSDRLDDTVGKFYERHCRVQKSRQVLSFYGLKQTEKLLEDLYDAAEHAEFDNQYLTAILDGSWPDARQILTRALAKCPPEENK